MNLLLKVIFDLLCRKQEDPLSREAILRRMYERRRKSTLFAWLKVLALWALWTGLVLSQTKF
jgi:hypothetical protein